jgi:hypothetical protein
MARFRNPISISRDELMRASKIGSVNTYIRSMKELHSWQYIKYIPSFNPQKGSQVYLYNFNNSNNNGSDISPDKGNGKAHKKATGKTRETQVIPSINNTNIKKQTNNKNTHESTRRKSSKKSPALSSSRRKAKEFKPPGREEVKSCFRGQNSPAIEAEKFFNYYQSNGWLVGGKTPMKNWKAAAKNWMLNTEKFSTKGKSSSRLHVKREKDYDEPL